jgi:aldose 1-epimerase
MRITKASFGKTPEGREIEKYTISNSAGLQISIITYGGIIQSLKMPDRNNRPGEITLGFDLLKQYLAGHPYFGAIVGRYANRISKGSFAIDGKTYTLACNENGKHHLHGGIKGFDKKIWNAEPFDDRNSAGIKLSCFSPDNEEGYPGNLNVTVTYCLNESNELIIEYMATTNKPTPVNLTNHAYWNLAGAGSGTILGHELMLNCQRYLPTDEQLIPTGEIRNVRNTPFDFTKPKPVEKDIVSTKSGYDHCLVIADSTDKLPFAARLYDSESGRCMEVYTTMPGIQVYTGNFLDGIKGSGGAIFEKHGAICLETQYFPDAVNKPEFPSPILNPGQTYSHVTKHRFFIR